METRWPLKLKYRCLKSKSRFRASGDDQRRPGYHGVKLTDKLKKEANAKQVWKIMVMSPTGRCRMRVTNKHLGGVI